MNLAQEDIILVPFPFTNLKSAKSRPALVLHVNKKTGDFILLAITSQSDMPFSFTIKNKDLSEGQLPLTSFVRIDKIATLNLQLVKKKVARLKSATLERILNLFKKQF